MIQTSLRDTMLSINLRINGTHQEDQCYIFVHQVTFLYLTVSNQVVPAGFISNIEHTSFN